MVNEKSVMAVIRASRPSFRNAHDKVAFVVHASFLASGFVLSAAGAPAFADNALSSSSSDEVGIEGWNEAEDEYAFVYVNPEKGNKKVLVKCSVMGDKFMLDALSDGASEQVHLDISVNECVAETDASDYNSQYKNLGKLVSSFESDVLAKLDGGSDGSHFKGPSSSCSSEEPNRNIDGAGSSEDSPAAGFVLPPVNPVGRSDLFPSGGAGIYPSRGGFGSGSMLVGPEDPRWFGGGAFSGIPGRPGGLGGPPPAARFDPYGPPGVPGFEPGRFGRFPRGPAPGGGTHPDLQPGIGGPGRRIHPDLEQPGSGGFDFI